MSERDVKPANLPFVWITMPTTASRRARLPNAIKAWQAQDYPADRFGVLVLEDGPGTVRDLVPTGDPRIQWGRVEGERSLGMKFNEGIALAPRDAWIGIAGDDDWVSPRFLSWLVGAAQEHKVDIVGGLGMMVWHEPTRQMFMYGHPEPVSRDESGAAGEAIAPPYLIGGMMLMHERHWRKYPLPDQAMGSDGTWARLVLTMGGGENAMLIVHSDPFDRNGLPAGALVTVRRGGQSVRYLTLVDPRHYMAVMHKANTGAPFGKARCTRCEIFLVGDIDTGWAHPINACELAGKPVTDSADLVAGSSACVYTTLPEGYGLDRWARWMGEDAARRFGIIQ